MSTRLSPFISVVNDALQALQLAQRPLYLLIYLFIDIHVHDTIVSTLSTASRMFVFTVKRIFFKFWWNKETSLLKEASVKSDKSWKATGKPRDGPMFGSRQYRRPKCRRDCKKLETMCYTNDLHDALLQKNSRSFWQCWRSKFDHKNQCIQVDGCVVHIHCSTVRIYI